MSWNVLAFQRSVFSCGLRSTERLVLLALAAHADEEGRCFPSVQRLAECTGFGRTAVLTALRTLEVCGLTTEKTWGKSTRYDLTTIRLPDQSGSRTGSGGGPNQSGRRTTTSPGDGPDQSASRTLTTQELSKGTTQEGGARAGAREGPTHHGLEMANRIGRSFAGPPPELPPDDPETVELARRLDLSIAAEWEACRDHHRSKATTSADWPAEFRTWLRRTARFRSQDADRQAARAPPGKREHDQRKRETYTVDQLFKKTGEKAQC